MPFRDVGNGGRRKKWQAETASPYDMAMSMSHAEPDLHALRSGVRRADSVNTVYPKAHGNATMTMTDREVAWGRA